MNEKSAAPQPSAFMLAVLRAVPELALELVLLRPRICLPKLYAITSLGRGSMPRRSAGRCWHAMPGTLGHCISWA